LHRSFEHSGGIENKTIMMVGDLRRGRTIRSLARLLTGYAGIKIIFSSPEEFKIQDDLRSRLREKNISFEETGKFNEVLPDVDAIYMTRVQDEYDAAGESKKVDYSKYCLRYEHLKEMKGDAIILHPLPRRDELDPRIDRDPRAKYWRQERNGMWVRVALISMIFGVHDRILLPHLGQD